MCIGDSLKLTSYVGAKVGAVGAVVGGRVGTVRTAVPPQELESQQPCASVYFWHGAVNVFVIEEHIPQLSSFAATSAPESSYKRK